MEWTREQEKAIYFRENKNILLAAAAGSGKTAVLVERIINRIKDKENPLSVSELLVLTFTEAAAAEMKRKIMSAIKLELEANPENEHLRKQSILLHSASISTVHSFCNKILKGHIHLTDLPADFSLATEGEADLLLKQAINKTLEKYYSKISLLPSFSELCSAYGGVKGDANLRALLYELYLFSKSLPYPYEWLNKSVKTYKTILTEKSLKNTVWHDLKKAEEDAFVGEILSICDAIKSTLSSLPEDHKYPPFYQAEADLIKETLSRFENGDEGAIENFKFPAKVRKQNTYPIEEQTADDLRELLKKTFASFGAFLASDTPEAKELLNKLYLRAKTLKNIIIMIDKTYAKLKREKNLLDFSDLEHGLLKLISDKDKNPTPLALELRKRYSEILLDEYQDTNHIQEEIFSLLSRDNKNIFMVGDLKQSIYKFRNAVPEIFAKKRREYLNDETLGKLIRLNKNFRSRKDIIGTVNFIFSSLISKDLGDIDYNESEFLTLGATFPDPIEENAFDTEYYVVENSEEMDSKECEAHFIAKRIEDIVNDEMDIYDSKNGITKKAEYRDIVILLRNRSESSLIESALEERGIPAYSDSGKSYLTSPEVGTILSFLNIIDNPYQDIPLIAVLRSKMFSFTPDELAKIRLAKKDCWFYDALLESANQGFDKAKSFIFELERLREEAKTFSVYKLILTIYERFGCLAILGLMENPSLRRANLRLFAQRALDFERTKARGLFGFMNYLENLKAEKRDLPSAKETSEGENVVRIMTIHKSKGLEFPIVFLADTAHKFNIQDTSRTINFHQQAGISLEAVDTEYRIKYPSLSSSLFKAIQKRELLSEEMRLLYVALTRAKEKLIITSAVTRSSSKMSCPLYGSDKKPLVSHLKSCQSFADWISASLLTHPSAKVLRESYGYDEDIILPDSGFNLKADIINSDYLTTSKERDILSSSCSKETKNIEYDKKAIYDILSYNPPATNKIPVKITVSELKRRLSEEGEYTPRLIASKNIYLKKKEELSSAEKGTITHFVLQHIDESKINSKGDLSLALSKMESDGTISFAQKSVVDTDTLMKFFESELGKRLKSSSKTFKEYSFYSHIKAGEILEDLSEEEKDVLVLLQGTIDCVFEDENKKLILLDYKTDNIKENEAQKRAKQYKIQLDCYNNALKTIFGKEADESYIYFLSCNKAVKM